MIIDPISLLVSADSSFLFLPESVLVVCVYLGICTFPLELSNLNAIKLFIVFSIILFLYTKSIVMSLLSLLILVVRVLSFSLDQFNQRSVDFVVGYSEAVHNGKI